MTESKTQKYKIVASSEVEFHPASRKPRSVTRIKNREVIDFSNWDIFELAFNTKIRRAVQNEIEASGAGNAAFRSVSGTSLAHLLCESRIAQFLLRDKALLFPSSLNVLLALFSDFFTDGDLIIVDEKTDNPGYVNVFFSQTYDEDSDGWEYKYCGTREDFFTLDIYEPDQHIISGEAKLKFKRVKKNGAPDDAGLEKTLLIEMKFYDYYEVK